MLGIRAENYSHEATAQIAVSAGGGGTWTALRASIGPARHSRRAVLLSIVASRAEEVAGKVYKLARKHRLVCFDPQQVKVIVQSR